MKTIKRIAAAELLLIFPGALFMTALLVRNIQPAPYETAQTAQRVVEWFSGRLILGLYVFLFGLPFAAFVIGCTTLLLGWRRDAELRKAGVGTLAAIRANPAILLIAVTTVAAGGILAIVALHVMMN